jgi:hypothetical protein
LAQRGAQRSDAFLSAEELAIRKWTVYTVLARDLYEQMR